MNLFIQIVAHQKANIFIYRYKSIRQRCAQYLRSPFAENIETLRCCFQLQQLHRERKFLGYKKFVVSGNE